MSHITVHATGNDRKVLLWEQHPDHPEGEVLIAADGRTYEVGDTAAVLRLIKDGALAKGRGKAAPEAAPSEEETQVSASNVPVMTSSTGGAAAGTATNPDDTTGDGGDGNQGARGESGKPTGKKG